MGNWMLELTPNEYIASVYDLDLDRLWHSGKRAILTDLDNTLVPWNTPLVPNALTDLLEKARVRGFRVCIVSNNKGQRVMEFADRVGVPALSGAKKPKPAAFSQAMALLEVAPSETVMVGDQLFTDVRGGNRSGLYTVLVLPLHPREWWGTRIVRQVERFAMKRLQARGLQVPERRREGR
ncbi:YqeG family HAD IIIA-type phosphatase [Alicyclobacillus sp. ALC3]|uniref:YqeG family HAD IIIA-type phosphatase n=1 Tax=Alicyclobacillus sp. ALC3 TaxID=2796143 RepID=UPI002379AB63|nr:YqeG family HAD IIIA-type phosphatase [Alicyclobacillus sp. ALC3]WDL96312.1 YqeG family HAD IIIA-type phosphatase [Alicyclobacillus sp. ALC3]